MTHCPTLPESWRLSPLVLPALLALCDSPGAAAQARAVTDPAAIDRAVTAFTGAAIGAPGGARAPADPRLQLASCEGPLTVGWHGTARTSVQVECPGPASWRIFIAVNPGSGTSTGTSTSTSTPKAAPAVKRGDALTIVVRGRGFSVQQTGEAMQGGAIGEWIDVRTTRKAETLRARIERPGLAVIPAG